MKNIYLPDGRVAVVDDEDFDRVSIHKWQASPSHYTCYAVATINGKRVPMHVFITGHPLGKCDHIDRDGLNNTKANLRFNPHNMVNRRRWGKLSKYRGVVRYTDGKKRRKSWRAQITVQGKTQRLGNFATEEGAAIAYNNAATAAFGEFAQLNEVSHRIL